MLAVIQLRIDVDGSIVQMQICNNPEDENLPQVEFPGFFLFICTINIKLCFELVDVQAEAQLCFVWNFELHPCMLVL